MDPIGFVGWVHPFIAILATIEAEAVLKERKPR